MSATRQTILRGPGIVRYSNLDLFDTGGITATIETTTTPIQSSFNGTLETIKTDQSATISLTPLLSLSSDALNTLYPDAIRHPAIGMSLFGAEDTPAVIHARSGRKVTFASAALTGYPELTLSSVKTAFGPLELTALVANGKLPSEAGSFYTVTEEAFPSLTPPASGLAGATYTAQFGSLAIPETGDGWTVTVEPTFEAVSTDAQGTVDRTLSGVTVRAKCTPIGLSESQILSALPIETGRGSALGSSDLVITGSNGLTVTLKRAALVQGPLQWGSATLRTGEIGFVANLDSASGELFGIAYSAEG